jgi:uncharacterized membrane protein YfcA
MFRRFRNGLHNIGLSLHLFSKAQAEWEIETGRTILARRKKLLLLALAPVLVLLVWNAASGQPAATDAAPSPGASAASSADDTLPLKIPVLGGSKAYMPSLVTPGMFFGSVLVGLIAGLITGVIGAGGGYILTPALMSFGVRGIVCIGTDQFHMFAKAIMGTTIHRKLGNVNWGLAAWFVLGSFFGLVLGGWLSRSIFYYSPSMSDAVISLVYVLVLGVLGVYAIFDWLRMRRNAASGEPVDTTTGLARWLQHLPLKPRVTFDKGMVAGGRSICVYPVIVTGFVVGFVATIMGVGGGFLTFPMFVYGMGVSTFTTVGTSILQIIFAMALSSVGMYIIYGFVFYTVAVGMLVGSLVGVQLGALVTNVVKGSVIRAFYALTILAGFVNRLCALPRKLADLGYVSMSREASVAVEQVGVWLFFGIVGVFACWIVWVFVRNLRVMRCDAAGAPIPKGGPLVVKPRKLALGLAGLVVFTVLLAWGAAGKRDGMSVLASTDDFFNQLAKDSAYFIPEARKKAVRFAGESVDIAISPREHVSEDKARSVISDCACALTRTDDGRLRIRCAMGKLCETALADAELAFRNNDQAFLTDHRLRAHEAVYCWWIIFDGLSRRYVQENRPELAEFTKLMATKVLEPAYNYRGIEARNVRENAAPLAGYLAFYILYTLWYGFSILFVIEGFGISMTAVSGRTET